MTIHILAGLGIFKMLFTVGKEKPSAEKDRRNPSLCPLSLSRDLEYQLIATISRLTAAYRRVVQFSDEKI